MPENKNPQTKHLRSFWPIVIILVFAIIMAGLIWLFEFNLSNDYDLASLEFHSGKASFQKHMHKTPALPKTLPAK